MAEKLVNEKPWLNEGPADSRVVGQAFAYRSSIWMIKGLYLAPTPSGERELWFIVGERRDQAAE